MECTPRILAIATLALGIAARPAAQDPEITEASMRETVAFLAKPEFGGRRAGSPQNREVAAWLEARFRAIGLEPAVDGSFHHDFRVGELACRNVAGIVRAAQASEFVVVGAHHDGVGDRGRVHYPAADDNASGIAALLEIAEAAVAGRSKLARHVVFVAFDAEEIGLLGSAAFVRDEVVPSDDTRFALIFDMIGGRFFPWQDRSVAAMGTEHSAAVRRLVDELAKDRPTAVHRLGTWVLEPAGPIAARSDYRDYRKEDIPFLFLSTGTPWYYHQREDTPDRVDFAQAVEITGFARDLVLRIAATRAPIDFIRRPDAEVEDMVELRDLLGEILEHRDAISLDDTAFTGFRKLHAALARAIDAGKASRRLGHLALQEVFRAAGASRPRKK